MPLDPSPTELSRVALPPDKLRGRWLWTLDALMPRLERVWGSAQHELALSYAELAAMAAIYAQLDWNNGVTYPPDTPLIGRPDLLAAVVDGGRRTG